MLALKTINLNRSKVEALVVPVCEDAPIHQGKIVSDLVASAKTLKGFSGKTKEAVTLIHPDNTKVEQAVFFGIGKKEKMDAQALRNFAGKAIKHCIKKGFTQAVIAPPASSKTGLKTDTLYEALMEGAALGNQIYDAYKKEKKDKPLKKVTLMASPGEVNTFSPLAKQVEIICQGTILARQWVTTPSNDKRPEEFARLIEKEAKKAKLTIKTLDDKALKQKKMGSLLSVSQGSTSKPRMVVLEYAPKNPDKTLVFVGKGVTFDTGGINLKPSAGMAEMKMDMSGAAVVAGAMTAIARLKPKAKVVGIMPLVENMPSGQASRPGDIVRSFEGKTVEIGNTDAEGRLILIDAMAWAVKQYKPDTMIDLATLTGACVVALGEKIAGVFSPDQSLSDAIVASGDKTHERCWPMPMPDDYRELLKSPFADLSNMSSSRWGGAITAALFLSEFVGDTRWAHIDIAGPSWQKKATDTCGAGGTGFGVRLLCDVLNKL